MTGPDNIFDTSGIMDMRYTTDPKGLKSMPEDQLRRSFLIDNLFIPDDVPMTYSDIDRSVIGTAVPVKRTLKLPAGKKELSAEYFTERREIGVINIGNDGSIEADGKSFELQCKDALYIGQGVKSIEFKSKDPLKPAKYYFASYPAHNKYPVKLIRFSDAAETKLGNQVNANRRTINKLIHPGTLQTCQIVMGLTELEEGSVWNTMPPHTHLRRSEVYMYFNTGLDDLIIHLMGKPEETRHLIVRNEQAVLSPSWSIHAGVGTGKYSFIWAMGGENQVFSDMDDIPMKDLR